MKQWMVVPLCVLIIAIILGCAKKPGEEQLFTEAKQFQEESQFQKAVDKYQELIALYPKSPLCAQSQFMIGYIYANHIQDFDAAKEAYVTYLELYADDEMSKDAKWELEHLGEDINSIDELLITDSLQTSSPETTEK
jgi:outer membrane protein assembly factor BamD (BamD/ComL family)